MGGMKILTGGQRACQEASRQRKEAKSQVWQHGQQDRDLTSMGSAPMAPEQEGQSRTWALSRVTAEDGLAGTQEWAGTRLEWWPGSGMKRREAQGYLPPSSGKNKGKSCSFRAGQGEDREHLTSQPLAHSSAAWLHGCMAAPQPTTSPTSGWVDKGRFAHRKALKCHAGPSWGFNHTVISYRITFPESNTSCQSNKYKFKFLLISKKRNIPGEHVKKSVWHSDQ